MSELTLVTLPIGNMGDITLRALEALKVGKVFYAEDTRVFKEVLKNLGIEYGDKFIDSFHDQSVGKVEQIVAKILGGEKVYLVSDAGSPMVSDPAYPLLKRLLDEKIPVKTLPGVTAVVTALELSSLPPHPFHFWGFIGRTKGEKRDFFTDLGAISGTHIFFESPHRVFETIESFFEVEPENTLVVTRELTKTYESVYRITKSDLPNLLNIVVDKGEFVLLFHNENTGKTKSFDQEVVSLTKDFLENGGSTKKLAKLFSKILGSDTKTVYDQLSRSGK
ncbi:MAG: 16S rRNA (cytidine(1402)-2'-O)-methyltransferase [Bdellovibrionales bacterium]|nr:16S rRNA (cytidine(1402)-2'-O)-methyltransferase [Bdellovibrionales bacterium]